MGTLTHQPSPDRQTPDWPALKAQAWEEFSGINGVEGIGLGEREIRIYVRNSEVGRQLPSDYRGVPMHIIVVGQIVPA